MSASSSPIHTPPKKRSWCCLTCLIITGLSLVCIAGGFFLGPPILQELGIFGRPAEVVYQLAPDPVASQQLNQVLIDRNIPGVRVFVIPMKGQTTQGAFVILDASKGYTGLSPLDDSSGVFLSLLQDLTLRNRQENLRITHVTVDYRDEQGISILSFTVDQADVEKYADGLISQEDFYQAVHLDFVETLRRMGVEEFLEESQP